MLSGGQGRILQSLSNPERQYTGLTSSVPQRLLSHSKGTSVGTRAENLRREKGLLVFSDRDDALVVEITGGRSPRLIT